MMDIETSHYLSKLKILATFLVVLVHSKNLLGYADYTGNHPFIKFFNTFATAGILIFFSVSGYLLFRREFTWGENIKKKCRSLLIPFLFWNGFWLLFELVGTLLLPAYFVRSFPDGLLGWFVDIFGIPFYAAPVYPPLWFVRDLFLLNAAAPVLKWIIDRFPIWLTVGFLAVIWFLPLPYKLWYNSCQSIVFFTFGGLIARKKLTTLNRPVKGLAVPLCVVIALASCIPGLEMWTYCARFLLLAAFPVLCIVARRLDTQRIAVWMPYSFPIYVLHGKPLSVLQILYTKLVPQSVWAVTAGYFLFPLVTIVLCMAAASIFRRCTPRIYAIATGAR